MIGSMWYWCIDQELVQRVLSAKNTDHAKGGTVLAGFLKLLPVFIITVPGIVARAFYERCKMEDSAGYYLSGNISETEESPGFNHNYAWCSTDLTIGENANKAYPYLIIYEFPTGIVGKLAV